MDERRKEGELVNPDVQHETSDVAVRPILLSAAAFVGMTALSLLVLWIFFRILDRQAERAQPAPVSLVRPQKGFVPPGPRLQVRNTAPTLEMQRMRQHEERILTTYGMVDRQRGSARMPIEEAMRMTVQRGLPARVVQGGVAPAKGTVASGAPTAAAPSQATAPRMDTGYRQDQFPTSDRNEAVKPKMPAPRKDPQ